MFFCFLFIQEIEAEALHRRSASCYTFNGDSFVEYLTGPSPVDIINGEKKYTVSDPEPKKKKKVAETSETEYTGPELGDDPSALLKFQKIVYELAKSSAFEFFIIFCIMINTFIMATETSTMEQDQIDLSTYSNYVSIAKYNN